MKIISKENVTKVPVVAHGPTRHSEEVFAGVRKLALGEALLVELSDWHGRGIPTAASFNYHMKHRKFSVRSIEGKKGWLILRVK